MSADAFATLKPTNALARLAFSDVYETFIMKQQNTHPAFHRMVVGDKQTFDGEVLQLRLKEERRGSQNAYASDPETSESLPEPDSDIEEQHQQLGNIWIGYHELRLEAKPSSSYRGYTLGKGLLENNILVDLFLCTKAFAEQHEIKLRQSHARLNFFPHTRGFYIANSAGSRSAQLIVNGQRVKRRPYALNQRSMIMHLDKLEYTFQWTRYADTEAFIAKRKEYVTRILDGPVQVDIDMPTPLLNTRTIGGWTLGEALGAGGHGRVFLGTNQLGEVAAIKMMERTSENDTIVDAEVKICKEITAFAEESDEGGRILRVVEVLYSKEEKLSSMVAFDNVALVLQPMTPKTLADMCELKSQSGAKGMTVEAAKVFRDALLGLRDMHHGCWTHRDLKPTNIGLIGTPARAIILDNGTSARIEAGTVLKPTPGAIGTIGYLAPELETKDYDQSIDIWSMGIILYQLTYKDHPWKFARNPWRDGKENEKLRPLFQMDYQEAIDKMIKDYNASRRAPTEGYIHLGTLFVDMVRYQWAENNHSPRPDIDEVLAHPAWGLFLPAAPTVKRQRLFGEFDREAV